MSSNNNSVANVKTNNTFKTNNGAKGNSYSGMGKIFFIIFVIVFIVGLIYVIYLAVDAVNTKNAMNPVVVNDTIDADVTRPAFNLPEVTTGLNQAFSTWIYVKDFNYKFGQYKNILW